MNLFQSMLILASEYLSDSWAWVFSVKRSCTLGKLGLLHTLSWKLDDWLSYLNRLLIVDPE